MNNRTIPLDYANGLLYDLQKAFWDERGRGARFRTTTVGREYFVNKCLPLLRSSELEQMLRTIGEFLQREGIADEVICELEDRLLKVRVEGCVHRPVEAKMVQRGIDPFTCVPANLVVLAIEEKLDRPVELAEIKTEEGLCQLLLVLFDKRPTLDQEPP
jgi:hypothetical protein